ncbi:hypothetical protein GCM10027187_40390 [Streptosporangium sandarakinum]|uniref:Uncharacterized protein n=1 Tax=Streptosporangium sandarakinum TaxID=1260955 RepID=A0A852V957_9ACTN|nr:hypothetical protein [Streptosporangium sandarakinum]NYF44630.1 hypothetical protein [Streptosporangium sandarakinum]
MDSPNCFTWKRTTEIRVPESWGRHLRVIIITIVIVLGAACGVDLGVLPFPRL